MMVSTMAHSSPGSRRPPREARARTGSISWAPPMPMLGFSESSQRASSVSSRRRVTMTRSVAGSTRLGQSA